MTITIRPCVPADVAALSLVGQATFLESYAGDLRAADILEHCAVQHGQAQYARWLADEAYGLWLAEAQPGDAPVGYAVLSPPDLPVGPEDGDVELKRIYLLHRFQGGGTGAALMTTVIEAARRTGARRMLLGVYGRNEKAIGFYARQGFTQVGVRQFQVGDSLFDDLVLGRDLLTPER